MTILELFQEKARMLLDDAVFIRNPDCYSCQNLEVHVREVAGSYRGIHDELSRLQTGFKEMLRADPMAVIGFELAEPSLKRLASGNCTAFVHVVCYDENENMYEDEELAARFIAARTAWLQFIIDKEV
ncbi:hypothetical protein VPHD480_0222 [Vibrio phage D480]